MAEGFLARLPDLSAVTQIGSSIQSGVGGVAQVFGALGQGTGSSPLASVGIVLGDVTLRLNIDTSGLSQRLPQALDTMGRAVAPGSVDFVRSIEHRYREARDFLEGSALARAVAAGRSPQEVALAAVEDALHAFDRHRDELLDNLVDADDLRTFQDMLRQLEALRSDFAAHRAEFLPFLSRNLLGVAPDILRAPLAHVRQALTVLGPLDPAALRAAMGGVERALAQAFRDLNGAVAQLDPADPAAYARIDGALDAVDAALIPLRDAAQGLYAALQGAVESHAWDEVFGAYRGLLDAISIDASLSVDGVVQTIVQLLEAVFARLQTVVGPADLVAKIETLNGQIRDLFANSPLGQVRQAIRDFLGEIRHAIESVPTQEIQDAVHGMLDRVRQEVEGLGVGQIAETIENALRDAETFINDHINDALGQRVHDAVESLLQELQRLPLDTLVNNINQVVAQLEALIQEIEAALQSAFDQLSQVLAQLDELSFQPVGDTVVEEINELRDRLQQINPNALSDAEKLALKGALAVVQAIDLEGFVHDNVKAGFASAKDELLGLLGQVTQVLAGVRDRVDAFNPERLTHDLAGVLDEAKQAVESLNSRALMQPSYDQVDALRGQLAAVSPGPILDPLQAPYARVRGTVDQLNPDRIVAPLNALYEEAGRLIDRVDITPLLDELDRRQKALFADVRSRILGALDGLSLPEPLAGFYGALKPALEAMTDAVFANPDEEIRRVSLDLAARFRLSDLFAPLDRAFEEVVGLIESAPVDDLVDTMNTIRRDVGLALDAIDPGRVVATLRAGQGQLRNVDPRILFAMPASLPSLKTSFSVKVEGAPVSVQGTVTLTLARFDTVAARLSPLIAPLSASHAALEDALRRRINALDASGALEAYGRVRRGLDSVVPGFLRGTAPLSREDILVGVRSLRPSQRAGPVDAVFDRFLRQLQPMQAALEPAINNFFKALRDTLMLLNPLSLKDAVADLYTAIRAKVRVLDPAALAADLHAAIFDPVLSALDALDPARLKTRLDAAFQSVMDTLTNRVKAILDQIAAGLDEQLQRLKTAVASVIERLDQVISEAARAFQEVIQRVEHLVFVEILERLRRVIETLGVSFDRELERVKSAFDEMLAAIPLAGPVEVSATVSL